MIQATEMREIPEAKTIGFTLRTTTAGTPEFFFCMKLGVSDMVVTLNKRHGGMKKR